jgi:hypothetical protein
MEHIEEIKGKGGLVARIYQDPDPMNPRENDNLGRIATVSTRRYDLADSGETALPDDLSGWDAVEKYLKLERGALVILPVYLYDHSGYAISTKSFVGRAQHAEWDSGRVGCIYATTKQIKKTFMVDHVSESIKKLALKGLEEEIEEYNHFIQGEAYGYKVSRETKCEKCGQIVNEDIGSCWGYDTIGAAMAAAMACMMEA